MVPITTVRIKQYLYAPLMLPSIFAYFLVVKGESKRKLIKDTKRFWYSFRGPAKASDFRKFYWLQCGFKEYRSVFYMRIGYPSLLFSWLLRPMENLEFPTPSRRIGGGLVVQHGWTTVIDAESIGENLWVNQNVTIGHIGTGHPRIGDNCRIGSGACVLGNITIGNNVNIGANAIVIQDVPDGATVCSPKAQVVKITEGTNNNGQLAQKAFEC